MLAWIGLHSSHSGHLEVRLDDRADMLHVKAVRRPETARHIRRVARRYWQLGMRIGAAFLLPAMQIAPPGAGHHIGGSFPMRAASHKRTETDIWGRPSGHRRVFAVDSAVFPSVPATTVALTAMANAWRIAAEAPLPERSL
jgi:choline dehydrogenase-like flavoprotein